jgi:serine/threonine-protein kinase
MPCPHCGAPHPPSERFCPDCGRALDRNAQTGVAGAAEEATRLSPGGSGSSGGWLTSSDSISHGRFAPGTLLAGRYRLIGLLGRGGMGEVYRADDLRLGQPVALKFLPDAVAADPARLAQFHNEVRTARQVSHPNVCRVYDIGDVEGHLFLSMELVDGEDLTTTLGRIGRFPEDKAVDVARQLCAGLAAAHERGVLHRDLKPANVMLDRVGKVRVMDFGLATLGTTELVRGGTPAYMAPEQLLGKEGTARSDIYALGLVLYEVFTGRRAWTASTLNELIEQQQSGRVTSPSVLVSALDPAIDRAILRCLDPDPAARPASALAVAASLPGGDPLAAALAAGETPSPAMVAAAGEGVGLRRSTAALLFGAVLAAVATAYVAGLRTDPLQRMRPELNAEVLAQKARDAIRALGYRDRAADEAFGFEWDQGQISDSGDAKPARDWRTIVDQRPSPLRFWYRRGQQAMVGLTFHHDLLSPGIVTSDDPPPISPGMIHATLDREGHLVSFEAIPPQVQAPPAESGSVEWPAVLRLAGLDPGALQSVAAEWNWLATADTRAAWTGTWPGTDERFRVEAAALYGQVVAFQLVSPWTRPWRSNTDDDDGAAAIVTIFLVLVLCILIGGTILAARNLRAGRGDRSGAIRLGVVGVAALWLVWICQVHATMSIGMIGVFLVAVVTTTFYGLFFWGIYLALEPFVRRHWPQTLVAWTTVLGGSVRDAVVGRDVLVGIAIGTLIAVLIRLTAWLADLPLWTSTDLLSGPRTVGGQMAMQAVYAGRSALFFFYLLFVFRVVLRNQWAAAVLFVMLFAVTDALDSRTPWLEAASTALYMAMLAAAVLRWGLVTLATAMLAANLMVLVPATTDPSAWYFGATVLVLGTVVALAGWAFYSAVGGRLFGERAMDWH